MNIETSKRVGAVMSTMLPTLTDRQHREIMAEVESGKRFEALPAWIQERVMNAELAVSQGKAKLI